MNEQAAAWAGEFGDAYQGRAPGDQMANVVLFERVRPWMPELDTVLEIGAGSGANLRALYALYKKRLRMDAVEVNPTAAALLNSLCSAVWNCSVSEWDPAGKRWDLVLTKGLLIHIPPDELQAIYAKIHAAARRYILLCEYYNPTPVEIEYRGKMGMLWKRDFAGEMLDRFPDLRLRNYGFVYHRDLHPQDDITWFLLEKHQDHDPVRAEMTKILAGQ